MQLKPLPTDQPLWGVHLLVQLLPAMLHLRSGDRFIVLQPTLSVIQRSFLVVQALLLDHLTVHLMESTGTAVKNFTLMATREVIPLGFTNTGTAIMRAHWVLP